MYVINQVIHTADYFQVVNLRILLVVLTCDPIQWPLHGYVRCDKSEFMYGSKCTVGCFEGYEMEPQPSSVPYQIMCDKSSDNKPTLDKAVPSCAGWNTWWYHISLKSICIENLITQELGNTNVVYVTCFLPCFIKISDIITFCENGSMHWYYQILFLPVTLQLFVLFTAITCPINATELDVDNGSPVCTHSNHKYDSSCVTQCQSGYSLSSGIVFSTCQEDKTWSTNLPDCEGSLFSSYTVFSICLIAYLV